MMQENIEDTVRRRIRGLRQARGWNLESLAAKCFVSASTLSRIETGQQRITLEQLAAIASSLGTSVEQLIESENGDEIVIRPEPETRDGMTFWLLSRESDKRGVTIGKMRITEESNSSEPKVHPGYEWFTVLSGIVKLQLGERKLFVYPGQAVEFSTMTPHLISAHNGPTEILTIFDREGEKAHLPK